MHTLLKRVMQQNGRWPGIILGFRTWLLLLAILLVNLISTTNAKKSKEDGPTLQDFKDMVSDTSFKNAFAGLLMDVLDDKGSQKKFVTMMKAIAEGHDGKADLGADSRWGWGAHATPRKSKKIEEWAKKFKELAKKPEYVKQAVRLFKFTIGNTNFRETFSNFLESTKIKVKDQRKKKGKRKQTEDSDSYE